MLITSRIERWKREAGKTNPPPIDVPRCLPLPFFHASSVLRRDARLAFAPDIILCVITPFKTIAFDLVQIKNLRVKDVFYRDDNHSAVIHLAGVAMCDNAVFGLLLDSHDAAYVA